jgi:hypothetical protein
MFENLTDLRSMPHDIQGIEREKEVASITMFLQNKSPKT